MCNDEVDKGLYFLGGDVVILGATAIAYANENYTVAIIGLAGTLILRTASAIGAATRAHEVNRGNGYVHITPTLQQSNLASGDGTSRFIPSMAMTYTF